MENPKNLILVIFGASGDLTNRMLIPAIFSIKTQNLLPEKFAVIGVSRTELTTEGFRKKMKEGIHTYSGGRVLNDDQVNAFCEMLSYISIDISSPPAYLKLKSFLTEIDKKSGTGGNYLFYMAIPPDMHQTVTNNLSLAGLGDQS